MSWLDDDHAQLMIILVVAALCSLFVSLTATDMRDEVKALQHQRTIDSMQILNLKQRRDTLVIHTTVVDGAIIKQRYCLGDSVIRIW